MSIFDKNIIEKEIDYLTDAFDNMEFQINRYIGMCIDAYPEHVLYPGLPEYNMGLIEYIKRSIEDLLLGLYYKDGRREIILPDWWKGPYLCVSKFFVDYWDESKPDEYGLRVCWYALGYLTPRDLYLRLDTNKYIKLYNQHIFKK